MSDESSFAARLAVIRLAAGMRKSRLAELSGLSKAAITRYESGTREPPFSVVVKLAAALNVPLSAFAPAPQVDPLPAPEPPAGRDDADDVVRDPTSDPQ